jgi:hypothetical protein
MGGATTAGGIYAMLDQLNAQKDDVKNTIDPLVQEVDEQVRFNPMGLKSGVGGFQQDATGGGQFDLTPEMQAIYDQALGGASTAMTGGQQTQDYLGGLLTSDLAGRADPTSYQGIAGMKDNAYGLGNQYMGLASQDPAAREQDIYDSIRAIQEPDEERALESMNADLFGSGRGGMSSAAYGGTPEQHAYYLAQGEAQNQAAYDAMDQAQQEMLNYGSMGEQFANLGSNLAGQQQSLSSQAIADILGISGGMGTQAGQTASTVDTYLQGAMRPYDMLNQQAQVGLTGQGMAADTVLNRLNMKGDLRLGELGSNINLSNIGANMMGHAIPALAGAAGGIGGSIDDAGSAGKWLSDLFNL